MVSLGLIVFFSAVFFGKVYGTKLQSRYLNSYRVNQLIVIAAWIFLPKNKKLNILFDLCASSKDAVAAGAQASFCMNTASR